MKTIDVWIGVAGVLGCGFFTATTLYDYAYKRGFEAARYACPPAVHGERLRYIEQPLNAERVVCLYARVTATANVRRNAQ